MNETIIESQIEKGKEKAALDFILSSCFKSGFGTLSKSELDLILFTVILKYSNQNSLADYELSKYLKITQQRVRNLKEKVSVKYMVLPPKKAIEIFVEKSSHAKIEDKYLDIPVNDIAVKNEIESILDKKNILLHYQLNAKIFRIRIDDFLELLILFETILDPKVSQNDIETRIIKEIIRKADADNDLAKKLTSKNRSIKKLTKVTFKEMLVEYGLPFGIDLLSSLIPGGVFLAKPVKGLITNIKHRSSQLI